MPSSGRTNIAVASGVSMAMAHCARAYHRDIPAALGKVPHKNTHAEKAARACGAWLALAAASARAHPCTMGKINIHLIMIFLCALSCIRVVMNAFMFHVCAERPYTTVVTTHSKLFYPYLPYRKNVECGNQFSSSCDSPLNLLLHLAHVQYLHTGKLVGCWNRLEQNY